MRLSKEKPLVIPDMIPDEILSELDPVEYETIAKHLSTYQTGRIGWDEFATRIPQELREKMKRIFKMCRQNGFYGPRAMWRNGTLKIEFCQLIETHEPYSEKLRPTLCDLCEDKPCDVLDYGGRPIRQDKSRCWRNQRKSTRNYYDKD